MPGGSIHDDETPAEAAVREVSEEVNLNAKAVRLLLSAGRTVPVEIGVMNIGSADNNNAVTFYEIVDQDTNYTQESFSAGDPLPGFPQPMGPPYPSIAGGDTADQ